MEDSRWLTPQKGGFTEKECFIGLAGGVLLYTISFNLCWFLMNKYWPRFRNDYSLSKKADNCSRFSSCLNCALSTPILIYGILTQEWGTHYEPLGDPSIIQFGLFIAVGYFLQDAFPTFYYRTPLWPVFLLHHIMAAIPFLMYFLHPQCHIGLLILSCFMLVEATNITYNVQQWLEDVDRTDNPLYVFLVYSTVLGWLIFRLANPSVGIYIGVNYIVPSAPDDVRWCIQPGVVCGYFVNAFCYTAFCVRILKDVIVKRWLNDPNAKKPVTAGGKEGNRRREAKKEM